MCKLQDTQLTIDSLDRFILYRIALACQQCYWYNFMCFLCCCQYLKRLAYANSKLKIKCVHKADAYDVSQPALKITSRLSIAHVMITNQNTEFTIVH